MSSRDSVIRRAAAVRHRVRCLEEFIHPRDTDGDLSIYISSVERYLGEEFRATAAYVAKYGPDNIYIDYNK